MGEDIYTTYFISALGFPCTYIGTKVYILTCSFGGGIEGRTGHMYPALCLRLIFAEPVERSVAPLLFVSMQWLQLLAPLPHLSPRRTHFPVAPCMLLVTPAWRLLCMHVACRRMRVRDFDCDVQHSGPGRAGIAAHLHLVTAFLDCTAGLAAGSHHPGTPRRPGLVPQDHILPAGHISPQRAWPPQVHLPTHESTCKRPARVPRLHRDYGGDSRQVDGMPADHGRSHATPSPPPPHKSQWHRARRLTHHHSVVEMLHAAVRRTT